MRILFCIRGLYNSGGTERILTDRANYLAEIFKYECMIVTLEQKNKKNFYKLSSKIQLRDLDIDYSGYYKMNIFKKIVYFFKEQIKHKNRLKKILEEYMPDIVISLGDNEKYILPKIYKGKLILEHHFEKYYRFKEQKGILNLLVNYILLAKEKKLKKYYDEFLVLTEEDKNQWKNIKARVIPNFLVNFPLLRSDLESKKVISVGRLEYQKGYDILIEVWNKVKQKYPDWILDIYGEGSLKEALQKKINKYGLQNNIYLKGREENIQKKYLDYSMYILSSRYEGFGMVLIEAQASGLPVVSFDCPCGPKDIINHNKDGLLCKNGNIDEMAQKIIYLIENKEVRKEFGKNAQLNSFRFSKERIMNEWNNLIKDLVKNGGKT